jgi:hypothetical protein
MQMEIAPFQDERFELARVRFGLMIKAWMRSGGWSTKTPMEWAKAAGFPQISNNTVSFIWAGTQPKTSPRFFTSLGYLNERLAARDYGPIQNRALMDRIKALKPITDANGRPWSAVDFFACYIGHLDPPPWFDSGTPPEKTKLLSAELAQRISSQKQQLFEHHATSHGLSKAEAWAQLKQHCDNLTNEQLDAFQQVLCGWRSWTPQELEKLKDADGHNCAVLALQDWCGLDLCRELKEVITNA